MPLNDDCFNNVSFIEEVKNAYKNHASNKDEACRILDAYIEDVFHFNAGIFTLSIINALLPVKFFDKIDKLEVYSFIAENKGIIYTDN